MIAVMCCAASDLDEFKVKREGPFEFAQKPTVARDGDRVTIAFEAKAFCDATVAVEDEKGRIVRHLASGVLGPNAPEPFRRNAKKQDIVWDGKDDRGTYVDDADKVVVRVSLGLKPRFERTLRWSPHRRIDWNVPLMVAAPEGVYVLDDRGYAHLRLFDHEGAYVRTVYPFPREKIDDVKGLARARFPQTGEVLPFKYPYSKEKNVLLSSGDHRYTMRYWFAKQGWAATAMAVHGRRIALAEFRLNRLATDGSTGGMPLEGPWTAYGRAGRKGSVFRHTGPERIDQRKSPAFRPASAAFSPDGKWLYLTGFYRKVNFAHGGIWQKRQCLHGVVRLAFADDSDRSGPEPFLGKMDAKGDDPGMFCMPTSVDCDTRGRVYVSDYVNDRVQVFAPDGAYLKSIAARKPACVRVHRRTGEMYVFSWALNTALYPVKTVVDPTVTVFGPLDDLQQRAACPLPYAADDKQSVANRSWEFGSENGVRFVAEIDSWADVPTIWIAADRSMGFGMHGQAHKRSPWRLMGIHVYSLRDGKWTEERDFAKDTARASTVVDPPKHYVQFPLFNPGDERWYIADGGSLGGLLWRLDPTTDRVARVPLPFASNETVFGPDGYAYLKNEAKGIVARWDLRNNREVPWDYGQEVKAPKGRGTVDIRSALPLPRAVWDRHTESKWEGMAVSPTGLLAIATDDPPGVPDRRGGERVGETEMRPDLPPLFPGRLKGRVAVVWDQTGRVVRADALPGITRTWGLEIDRDGNLYVLAAQCRVLDGKRYFIPNTGTLMKIDPARTKVLSTGKGVPIALTKRPERPIDLRGEMHRHWVENAEWMYGGVGFHPHGTHCGGCINGRFALDRFARSFAPEIDLYSVAVLDSNGNLILRFGTYGNVGDGRPLIRAGGPPNPRSIGGDEVALFCGHYVGVHTDRRVLVADPGNARIVSVKLDYYATERVALKNVRDGRQ